MKIQKSPNKQHAFTLGLYPEAEQVSPHSCKAAIFLQFVGFVSPKIQGIRDLMRGTHSAGRLWMLPPVGIAN